MASISEGMNSKLDILIEVQRETLDAIKRLADTQEIRLDHVEKEIKDIWKEFEKHSESRRIIYDKLEQQSRTCAGRHGLIDERSHKDGRTLKDIAFSSWGIIGAAVLSSIGTQIAMFLLRR